MDEECREIRKIYGEMDPKYKDFTLESIPMDDTETWEIFGRFNTKGVFQFASPVSKPVLIKMKPQNMEELAAATSLIRPGTAGLDDYVAGKFKTRPMKKIDSRLSTWLESTYGAIVFQE